MTPIEATFLWLANTFGKDAIESGVKLAWNQAHWENAARQYTGMIEHDYGRHPLTLSQSTPHPLQSGG